jgi:hypothetical protein
MKTLVHHQPVAGGLSWDLHVWEAAWDGNLIWDRKGTLRGATLDFQLPDVSDPRLLQFKYNSTSSATGQAVWEPDDFIRRLYQRAPQEIWTFDFSGRVLYQNPFPAGVTFNPGDVLTVQVITQSQFRGGKIYAWNPYDPANPSAFFPQTARVDATFTSTFTVTLASWMTGGFHMKLMRPGANGQADLWEPDASIRVWRPCDGKSLWLKSGENDVRSQPLALTPFALEVLYPAALPSAPVLVLQDVVENLNIPLAATAVATYAGSPLFKVGTYSASIYPGAAYTVATQNNVENPPLTRPFPADPLAVSRFAVGASSWLGAFPAIAPATLSIQPHGTTSFGSGVSAQVFMGDGPAYQTVAAIQQPDGSWLANLSVAQNTTSCVRLAPVSGTEAKPYDWIDTGRYFTPAAGTTAFYTTEGVYGICASGETTFAEPPDRVALMEAMFGGAIVGAGVFAAREMPHGATLLGGSVYFVVHAPHAVQASLVLVYETAPAGPVRTQFAMTLTNDTFYWWCQVAAAQAASGARYDFFAERQRGSDGSGGARGAGSRHVRNRGGR